MLYMPGIDALRGVVEKMGAAGSDSLMTDLLQMLQDQSATVSRILNDVHCMQKFERGRFVLEKTAFLPGSFVRETVDAFRPAFERRCLKVSVTMASLGSVIPASADRCQHAKSSMNNHDRMSRQDSALDARACTFGMVASQSALTTDSTVTNHIADPNCSIHLIAGLCEDLFSFYCVRIMYRS